ncbi:MAG: EAL domain-containing protein [Acidobacteriota bacterium]
MTPELSTRELYTIEQAIEQISDPLEVERALGTGQFVPWFQPLVALRTGQLAGFEVLARWNHPDFGILPPGAFVPMAERDGWITCLMNQILAQAITAMSPLPPFNLAFNVSPLQLQEADLPRQIRDVAERAAFPLDRLTVEITETAFAHNLQQARIIAEELKAMGCRIALDDFGTGYSSLCHLQSLPIHELKVDRSFVHSMTEDRGSRKIVAAVVGLGQSLEMTTLAEGIERPEQADMLLWLGCDLGQGWHYGTALPAEMLDEMISTLREPATARAPSLWESGSICNLQGLPAQRLAQLQAVYDGAPVGLGYVDRQLRYVNINSRLAEMHGASVEEHFGKTLPEMIPQIYPSVEPHVRRALSGECVTGVEITEPDSEDSRGRTFLVSYQPARDEAGEIVGVSCSVLDFTERKMAEERLRQFESVIESLEEMMVVIDRNYRYLLANRAYLEYRGAPADQVVGHLVPAVIGQETFERVVKPWIDEAFKGRHIEYRTKQVFPRYGERDLTVSYAPIEDESGVRAVACILRDVTELTRMELTAMSWQKRMELAQQAGLRIGLWDWDLQTNAVVCSEETYRQWGLTREAFSGRLNEVVARIHPDDRDAVEAAICKVLFRRTGNYASQFRVVRPDSSICWIDAQAVILSEPSPHMVGISVDITSSKTI